MNGICSAVESSGMDFAVHILEGYGHLDVLIGEKARADVFEPMLEWINGRIE